MACWSGDILHDTQRSLKGISLDRRHASDRPQVSPESSLRFLSLVEIDRIPLYLCVGPSYKVSISDEQTEAYLSSLVLPTTDDAGDQADPVWWHGARSDSPLGLLVACESQRAVQATHSMPRVTELLIYASRNHHDDKCGRLTPPRSPGLNTNPDPEPHTSIAFYAVPLSSDLVHALEASTISSTTHECPAEPTFISCTFNPTDDTEVINIPPTRKRKSLNEQFDEAAERRRKARRMGCEGATAMGTSQILKDTVPSLNHRRVVSNSHSVSLQTRPLSRASSVSNAIQLDSREASLPALVKRSALSRVKSVSALPDKATDDTVENRNKELISRIVMAGMRLYGYSQRKSRRSRSGSVSHENHDFSDAQQSDEEYKLLYHQVFKATCFTFRRQMLDVPLLGHSEALRETVDKLLAVFCTDPLQNQLASFENEVTPGGRQAFGASGSAAFERQAGFTLPGHSVENTPCNATRAMPFPVAIHEAAGS